MKKKLNQLRDIVVKNLKPMSRYFIVGGIAFAVDFGILIFLTSFLNVFYLTSAAIGFLAGLVINYTLSILWVFDNRKLKSRRNEFVIFAVIGLIGMGMNHGIMYLSTDVLGLYYLVSKVISQGVVFLFNYISRKIILF